jgi:hypothetical protein
MNFRPGVNSYCFCNVQLPLSQKTARYRRGSRNFWWGDHIDEEKIGRGLGAAVGPQRGPGAEPLVGVKGAKPPTKVTLFSRIIQ